MYLGYNPIPTSYPFEQPAETRWRRVPRAIVGVEPFTRL
jgi:hypothetical protein